MAAGWESWQHSLPQAPHADVKQIRGNVSDAEKQINANILAYFTTGSGVSRFPPFGSEIVRRLKIIELNVRNDESTGNAESEVVLEIEVTESEPLVVSGVERVLMFVEACAMCMGRCTAAAQHSFSIRKFFFVSHAFN
jgi:hypothetical protein